MDLNPEESKNFWPIYNQYDAKMRQLREEADIEFDKGQMSDAEAEVLLNKIIDREQKELDLKKEYIQKMKSAISIKKIAKLFVLERRFKSEMIKRFKDKMGNRKGGPKGE